MSDLDRIHFSVKSTNPDEIRLSMTVTMDLIEWKKLALQLDAGSFPSFKIKREVQALIDRAAEHFTSEYRQSE